MNEFNNYYIICHFIGREINYVYVYVFIGLGLSDTFAKSLLSENGYFIGFWQFWPNFRLILHTPK